MTSRYGMATFDEETGKIQYPDNMTPHIQEALKIAQAHIITFSMANPGRSFEYNFAMALHYALAEIKGRFTFKEE